MATNGIGWCVEGYGVKGWQQITRTVPTREEAELRLESLRGINIETRVYEVLA